MNKIRKTFDRYLTEHEEKQLLSHIRQFGSTIAKRDAAWLDLLLSTGIRINVMANLTVSDARQALQNKQLLVRSEINKGRREYSIHLSKRASSAIKTLLALRAKQPPYGPDSPLVVSRHHQALSVRSYQERLQHWRKSAGLKAQVSPHWCRHTLAKRIIARSQSSNPLSQVQLALGHSNIVSTGVYTYPDKEEMAEIMEVAS